MTEKQILFLRNKLIEKREEIFNQVSQLESRWEDMKERAIELEEEAQKASIAESYTLLDDRGKAEIDLIDLALNKIVLGEYAICESCGDEIAFKRLDALPWARLCVECARDYERRHKTLPSTTELIGIGILPDKYRRLSGKQLLAMINEQFRKDGRVDIDQFTVSIQNGVIHLEGTVLNDQDHEVVLEILAERMGFSAIIDHLEIAEVPPAGRKRAAVKHSGGVVARDQLIYDQEEMAADFFERQDEDAPYRRSQEDVPRPAVR